MKVSIRKWVSLLLSAAILTSLFAGSALAAETENLIELTDHIAVSGNTASQKGELKYSQWTANGVISGTKVNEDGTFDILKQVQTTALDWQNPFEIDAAQFSVSKKTVINIKFKVMLDTYTTATKPRVGIRLYKAGLMHREALSQSGGKNAFVPTLDTEKNWSIASFVIDPEANNVYSSFNGSDYTGSALAGDVADGYAGTFRIYLSAIPGAESFEDGKTALETPVTWYIDEFTAYETDEMPVPPERPETEAEEISYIVKLDDNMKHNASDFSTSQLGTLYFTKINETSIGGYDSVGSNWNQIKLTENVMSDWKNNFYIPGSEVRTDRKTIVDIKFKLNADDYNVDELPQTKLRFYHNMGLFQSEINVPLSEADKDSWQTMRFVINNEDKSIYSSLNGAAYTRRAYLSDPGGETFGEKDGQIRIYPSAVPVSGDKVDGETSLSTPVNWYIDSFKAYHYDGDMPSPGKDLTEGEDDTNKIETLLRLTDSMQYNAYDFSTTQAGYDLSMGFVQISGNEISGAEPNGGFYKQLKLTQTLMSEWKNHFNFDGSKIAADKKTVIDIKFKVNLEDYSAAEKPKVGMRLYSEDGSIYLDAMKAAAPDEADKDSWQTMRLILNNEEQAAYASLNGEAYVKHAFLKNITGDNYNTQIRIFPIALPGGEEQTDGVTKLSTPVNWYIDSVIVYQTSGAMPPALDLSDPTEPAEPELPDAYPEPEAAAIPAELAGRVVRSYPEGKMKAVILSFD